MSLISLYDSRILVLVEYFSSHSAESVLKYAYHKYYNGLYSSRRVSTKIKNREWKNRRKVFFLIMKKELLLIIFFPRNNIFQISLHFYTFFFFLFGEPIQSLLEMSLMETRRNRYRDYIICCLNLYRLGLIFVKLLKNSGPMYRVLLLVVGSFYPFL